ncbi:MAG: TIGR04255 family protein, partial [Planktothrix sp.]
MNIPDYQRVIYKRNPLIEVIGQVRFPTILKIDNQDPFEFQEQVRLEYPILKQSQSLTIPPEIVPLLPQIGGQIRNAQHTTYHFQSEDSKWQISLNRDSLTLSTVEYQKYEDFKFKLNKACKIFEKLYQPSFYTRVGLRYKDLILRSKLEIPDKSWSELISEKIASELYVSELSDSIQTIVKNLGLEIEEGQVNFIHGLVIVKDESQTNFEETGYLFDA